MVPHQCDIGPGLAPVQSSWKSRCFSEAILWMCPEMFCDNTSIILRAVKLSLDSSYPRTTCSSHFADFPSEAVSVLEDGSALLHTSNYQLVFDLVWNLRHFIFFLPLLVFFCILCKLKGELSSAEKLAFEAKLSHRRVQFCLHSVFNVEQLSFTSFCKYYWPVFLMIGAGVQVKICNVSEYNGFYRHTGFLTCCNLSLFLNIISVFCGL